MPDLLQPFDRAALTVTRLGTYVMDGLRQIAEDLQKYPRDSQTYGVVLWNPSLGTWSLACAASAANDSLDISGVGGDADDRMIDGQGRLVAPGALGTTVVLNTVATAYSVSGKAEAIPQNVVEHRQLPGTYHYELTEEVCGLVGAAGTVTEPVPGQLKILVDSVLDPAEGDQSVLTDHVVRVWLKAIDDGGTVGPQGLAGWYEDRPILWDGANNYIQTTTLLGQSVASTTSGDYEICLLGPIVRRVGNEPSGSAPFCFYTGTGIGNPVSIVTDWQNGYIKAIRCAPSRGGTRFNTLSVADKILDALALADDLSVAGDVDVDGTITTKLGVASGDDASVGGMIGSQGASAAVGTSNPPVEEECNNFYDIPANTLATGSIVRVRAKIDVTSVAAGLPTLRLRMGPTASLITARNWISQIVSTSGGAGSFYLLESEFRVVAGGNPLNLTGHGRAFGDETGGGGGQVYDFDNRWNASIGGGDGTIVQRVSASVQFAVFNAGNSATCEWLTVEVIPAP